MANPKLKYVEIDGVDVSSYVMSFDVGEKFDQAFKTAEIGLKNTVKSVLDFSNPNVIRTSVLIQRGVSTATETTLFRGDVESIEYKGAYVVITCQDKLEELKEKTVNKSYDKDIDAEAGVISEIFKDLINSYTDLTADDTSVQNSGSIFVRERFVLRRSTVYDACMRLAELLDWQFYYNPTDELVYFEPKGYTESSTVLEVGSNVVELPKWEEDSTNLFNKIIVRGVQQEINTEEGPVQLTGTAQADWNTTSVTLNNKPVQVKVFADSSNPPTTEKIPGFANASGTFDYTVDQEESKIIWSSTYNPSATDYAEIEYSYMLPTPVIRKNSESAAKYGVVERSFFKDELKNVNDVANWAQKQVNVYGFPFHSTTLKVKGETGLKIGTVHPVVDSKNGISSDFLIVGIKYEYPYRYDVLSVGDKTLRTKDWSADPLQRIKRLEEKELDNEDVLNQFIDSDTIIATRSVAEVRKVAKESGVLYWDDDSQGEWDNYDWGSGDDFDRSTVIRRVHPNQIYFEDFFDTDLVNTASTTCTVSTANHNLVFTDGEIYQSASVFLNKTTLFTSARLSISGSVTNSDNLTYFLSADNAANFETATLGTIKTFANTGTAMVLKILCSGTAQIDFTDAFGKSTPLKLEVNV